MTTIQRDLTPFETDRLELLRVRFSGMPDADEMIAETEAEYRSQPVPPDCPPWCGQPAGHVYDSTARDETYDIRFHEHSTGDLVSLCQEERRTIADGGIELLAPYVTTYTDNVEMDAERAVEHGAALLEAAAQLREIGGAR